MLYIYIYNVIIMTICLNCWVRSNNKIKLNKIFINNRRCIHRIITISSINKVHKNFMYKSYLERVTKTIQN